MTSSLTVSPLLVERIGWTLVHFAWQGLLVGLVTYAILRVLRGARPHVRYGIACVALALMVVAPVSTFVTLGAGGRVWQGESVALTRVAGEGDRSGDAASAANAAAMADARRDVAASASVNAHAGLRADRRVGAASAHSGIDPRAATAARVAAEPGLAAPPLSLTIVTRFATSLLSVQRTLPWLVGLWSLGVALLLVRLFGGLLLLDRLTQATRPAGADWQLRLIVLARRLRVRRAITLRECIATHSPAVIGWLRPVILLPASVLAGLTPDQIEAILAHEIAHIRRHDYIVNLLQSVAETLLFYHPAVWLVSRQIRIEREHCCDDEAVAVCGDVVTYASALADLERLRGSLPTLALAASGGSLLARVQRLLAPAPRTPFSWPTAGAFAAGLAMLGFMVTLQGSEAPQARGQARTPASADRTAAQPAPVAAQRDELDALFDTPPPAPPAPPAPARAAAPPAVEPVPAPEPPPSPAPVPAMSQVPEPTRTPTPAPAPTAAAPAAGPMYPPAPPRAMMPAPAPAPALRTPAPAPAAGPSPFPAPARPPLMARADIPAPPAVAQTPRTPPAPPAPDAVEAPRPQPPVAAARPSAPPRTPKAATPPPPPPAAPAAASPVAAPAPPPPPPPPPASSDDRPSSWMSWLWGNDLPRSSYSISDRTGRRLAVLSRGQVTLKDDDSDIQLIDEGGYFKVEERIGGTRKRVELRARDGQLQRRWLKNGVEVNYDAEAKQWFARMVQELGTRTGLGAEKRIARILSQRGPTALVDASSQLQSDHVRRMYLEAALTSPSLDGPTFLRILSSAGAIDSSYERAELLRSTAKRGLTTDEARLAYVQATMTIDSDYERARTLKTLLETPQTSPVLTALLKSAAGIDSDYERAEVLSKAAKGHTLDAASTSAFVDAARQINSDFERRRALTPLVERSALTGEVQAAVLESATGIDSDFERAELLSTMMKRQPLTDAGRPAFFAALNQIDSDFERARTLKEVLASQTTVTNATVRDIISSTLTMDSDMERANVLTMVASRTLDAPTREAFVQAASKLDSEMERNRALSSLLRKEAAPR